MAGAWSLGVETWVLQGFWLPRALWGMVLASFSWGSPTLSVWCHLGPPMCPWDHISTLGHLLGCPPAAAQLGVGSLRSWCSLQPLHAGARDKGLMEMSPCCMSQAALTGTVAERIEGCCPSPLMGWLSAGGSAGWVVGCWA